MKTADEYREKLLEAVAECDEALMEKYLGGEAVASGGNPRSYSQGLYWHQVHSRSLRRELQEQRACSRCWMRSWTFFRRRLISRRSKARIRATKKKSCTRSPDLEEPFAALAFKIANDPYVGQLCLFPRLLRARSKTGDMVYNSAKGKRERIGRLLQMHANKREDINEVKAGDIAATVGLRFTTTGDTLCNEGQADPSRKNGISRARHFDRHRAQDQGG